MWLANRGTDPDRRQAARMRMRCPAPLPPARPHQSCRSSPASRPLRGGRRRATAAEGVHPRGGASGVQFSAGLGRWRRLLRSLPGAPAGRQAERVLPLPNPASRPRRGGRRPCDRGPRVGKKLPAMPNCSKLKKAKGRPGSRPRTLVGLGKLMVRWSGPTALRLYVGAVMSAIVDVASSSHDVLLVRPNGRKRVAVLLSVFGDESYDRAKVRVFAVVGLFGSEEDWAALKERWLERTGGKSFMPQSAKRIRGTTPGLRTPRT